MTGGSVLVHPPRARRHRLPHRPCGFTLVEVLVALVIMATLALMAWQGVDGIVRTRDASQLRLEQTLRLGTVLAQWEQDLASLQETDAVPALSFDGKTLRLTRRTDAGVQLVAWSLAPSGTLTPGNGGTRADDARSNLAGNPAGNGAGQWTRWAGPSVVGRAGLQDSWLRSQLLQGNDPGLLRMLAGVSQVQLYCYRGAAWSNCQSSGDVVATPASGVGGGSRTVLPSGLRLVLTFAEGTGFDGTLTRDVAFGPQQP